MVIKAQHDLLIANVTKEIHLYVCLRANPERRPDHNRLQFYFLKCWHSSKCSHGMFACFGDWHFLFVTCLTRRRAGQALPSPQAVGHYLLLPLVQGFSFTSPFPTRCQLFAGSLFWHAYYLGWFLSSYRSGWHTLKD